MSRLFKIVTNKLSICGLTLKIKKERLRIRILCERMARNNAKLLENCLTLMFENENPDTSEKRDIIRYAIERYDSLIEKIDEKVAVYRNQCDAHIVQRGNRTMLSVPYEIGQTVYTIRPISKDLIEGTVSDIRVGLENYDQNKPYAGFYVRNDKETYYYSFNDVDKKVFTDKGMAKRALKIKMEN